MGLQLPVHLEVLLVVKTGLPLPSSERRREIRLVVVPVVVPVRHRRRQCPLSSLSAEEAVVAEVEAAVGLQLLFQRESVVVAKTMMQ